MSELSFFDQLRASLNDELPGESAHKLVIPVNRPVSSEIDDLENYRNSAVAIFLYETNDGIHSILIQRPSYPGVHGGQIAFPGGKQDPEDHNLEHTARREANEEINVPFESGQLVGHLSDIHIPVSKFIVKPYIFSLNDLPELTPDKREVDHIIHFNINHLLIDDNLKRTDIRIAKNLVRKNIPYFDIDGRIVWGATAMMLSEFRQIVSKFC